MRTRSRSRSGNNSPQREASPAIVEPLRIELPFLEDQFQEDTPPESPMADNRTMAELLQAPTEGNFFDKMPRGCLKIIESKSKVRQSRAKAVVSKVAIVEPLRIELLFLENQFQEDTPPESPMADNRTMAELLQAPTEVYEDAIVISKITANNFELKHGLINLVQNKQFFGHDKEDPYAHIRYFNRITSTMRVLNVPSSSIKLMLFPYPLEGAAWIWLEKEPPRSIQTWDDLVSKFINQFFPPSKTTNLRNEITRFQQRFDELFYEAWERFNDLLRACPHHENAYQDNIQEYVSQAAAANYNQGNTCFRPQMVANQIRPPGFPPHQNNQNNFNRENNFNRGGNFNQSNFNPSSFNQGQLNRPQVNQAPVYQAPVPQTQRVSKTDFESYVKANDAILRNMQSQGTLPGNTITNPKEELKGITTRSGVAYQGPKSPSPSKQGTKLWFLSPGITTRSGVAYQGPKTPSPSKQGTKVTKDKVQTPSSQNTAPVQPSVIQSESQTLVSKPVVAPVSAPMPNLKPSITYPSRRDNEKRRDQANEQIEKFYEIFKEMSFKISFTDALILMPKFASTLKALIENKEKLSEMARTTMNEHCLEVILNKLPRKLGDPGKFLIPCEFSGMDECLALADLGASINLMPLSVWEGLSLPELTPTCMTLELANRLVSKPIGIAKDVSFKVGVFHFPADFVTSRALIDVHKGELTLRIGNEAITYNLDQTMRYSANYNQMMANKIDFVESACKEYSQEVLGFSNVTASGTPTPQ
nr:reverse transcriptase domain-containing protein [Tanacetum cinerariifolium]